jgi:hypothetical protein
MYTSTSFNLDFVIFNRLRNARVIVILFLISLMEENNKKYPEGHFVGKWMAIGIAIFSGLGIPLAIITENLGLIGIGPAMGAAFGVAIGQSVEAKYKKEGKIRPLTEEERKRKQIGVTAGLIVLLLLALSALLFMVLR